MAEWCAGNGAQRIVTAHTLDDQAETLLMRLARGSGVDGLSAMPEETILYGVSVYRPLLDIPRTRLEKLSRGDRPGLHPGSEQRQYGIRTGAAQESAKLP